MRRALAACLLVPISAQALPPTVSAPPPLQSVAGLTGSPTAAQLKAQLNYAFSDLSGIIGYAQLPVGTGPNQVYPGNNPSGFITAAGAPLQSVAGLAGAPTAPQLKTALAIAAADVSGLGPVATASLGGGCTISSGALSCGGTGTPYTLPPAGTGTLGGVQAVGSVAGQWVKYIDTAGLPHLTQPAYADISGTVPIAAIPTGTGANQVYPGNNPSGFITAAGAPLQSVAGLAGAPTAPQLKTALAIAAADVSGLGPVATASLGGGCTISSGALSCGGTGTPYTLPPAGTGTLGGVQAVGSVAGQWVKYIDTSGLPHLTQPAYTDLSGAVPIAAIPVGTGAGQVAAANDARITGAVQAGAAVDSNTVLSRTNATRAADVVNVADYGAICDGSAHLLSSYPAKYPTLAAAQAVYPFVTSLGQDQDWAAMQAAWNVAVAAGGHHYVFPAGKTCVIQTTLNWTGVQAYSMLIDGAGATLTGKTTGTPVIDALGSLRFRMRDLTVIGSTTSEPNIGMQIGRIDGTGNDSSGHHEIRDVTIRGNFTFTAFYNLNSETTLFDGDRFWNSDNGPSFGLVQDGANHWAASSAYISEVQPVDSQQSFNLNVLVNCDIRYTGTGTGAPLWMENTASHRYINTYLQNASGAYGAVLFQQGVNKNTMLDMDVHFESGTLTAAFFITGGQANPTFTGFSYRDQKPFAASYLFAVDTNITSVSITDPALFIGNSVAGQVAFQSPSMWTLAGGRATFGAAGVWNLATANAPNTVVNQPGGITGPSASTLTGTVPFAAIPVGTTTTTVADGADSRITGAVQSAQIGVAKGVAGLNEVGGISVDPANRPPVPRDDLRWYSSGDGYNGYQTDTISFGALWGYTDPGGGFQMWQMAQPAYRAAVWMPVTGGLPCDNLTVLSCTAGISLYALTSGFAGSPGTLYRFTGGSYLTGTLTSHVIPAPGVPGNDSSFLDADKFCAGTALTWGASCWIVPTEQLHGYATSTDWGMLNETIATGVGTGTISGTTLTISACTNCTFAVGEIVTVASGTVSANTYISALGTGAGGTGTYTLSSSNTVGTATTVTGTGSGIGGTNGAKVLLTLSMAGCGNVATATTLNAAVAGGSITAGSIAIANTAATAQPGECVGGGGSSVQQVTGGGFTVSPVLSVVWAPIYAPSFPSGPNVNGARGMIWNTWGGSHDYPPAGLGSLNRLVRVAGPSYNPASAWFGMLGTSVTSNGQADASALAGYTAVLTSDGLDGINTSGTSIPGIQQANNSTQTARCTANNHTVEVQSGVPAVTVVNAASTGVNCWHNNDYVTTTTAWTGEAGNTGLIFGAPSTVTASMTAASFQGDVVAMMVGNTPASTGLAGSYQDINRLRISLDRMGLITPQATTVTTLDGGGTGNNGGDEGTMDWQRQGVSSLRNSGGQPLSTRSYNYGQSGGTLAATIAGFYGYQSAANYYHDSGCETSPACVMELLGARVELEHYCNNSGTNCANAIGGFTISGTTMTVTAPANIMPGLVLSGGTVTAGTVVTGFATGCYGFAACTYTVSPSQTSTCSTGCVGTATYTQTAAYVSSEFKNWIYQVHQLGNGYYGLQAALPAGTTGLGGTFVKGDRVTLSPPAGSGITCAITNETSTGGSTVASCPVVSIYDVLNGLPVGNILYPDHGEVFGGTLAGSTASPVVMSGWVPTGGSGTWGSATFTVTLNHLTVPKAVMGRMYLQQSTANTNWQLAVLAPVLVDQVRGWAGGGAGLYDDMLANALLPQPAPCTTITTCASLGTGYGADALHDQFGDPFIGPNNWVDAPSQYAYCSNDNEHLTAYCHTAAAGSYKAMLETLMPYQ